MIRIILSGGQTGVDRAAMDQAMEAGLLCTGWCPKGRKSEDGTIPERYPLVETPSEDYDVRNERNVLDADGVIVVVDGAPDAGTRLTIELAYRHEKPFYLLDLQQPLMPDIVAHWVRKFRIQIVNIAGPRESHSPGMYDRSAEVLKELFAFFAQPEEDQMLLPESTLDSPDSADDAD